MPNPYFAFRQFRIEQDNCAMKVSTDACIQGAWTPIAPEARNACDIGAGTGLLSLMLAQRATSLRIDAWELDPAAAVQAAHNVASSPFAERIRVAEADVRQLTTGTAYDLIICNPPFFENSLQSDNRQRMQARHTDTLSYNELAGYIVRNLAPGGRASVLLPATQERSWLAAANSNGLFLLQCLRVRPNVRKAVNRIVCIMGRAASPVLPDSLLTIYESPGTYTPAFRALLEPFYLHL